MTLEQRLERLKRENRWMRRIAAVGIAVATAVLLIGQGKATELPDLEVRSLTVKDDAGRPRATLHTTGDGGVQLLVRDAAGVERLSVGLSDHGVAGITLDDEKGGEWVSLSAHAEGGATLIFRNPRVESQLYLAVWEGGETRLSFSRKDRAVLDLWDNDGVPSIDLVTPSGKSGIGMTVLDNGSSLLSVRDADGKVVWKVPPHADVEEMEVARQKCKQIYDTVHMWKVLSKQNRLPSDLRELEEPIAKSSDAPYYKVEDDPWGNKYWIERLDDKDFRITSMGPDGQAGTDDDISYPPRDDDGDAK